MSWTDQASLWLSNAGFTQPPIEDLNAFSGYNIAIAGMVKDAEKTLPNLIKSLEIFGCAFDSAHIFVLESNSNDHTREIIKNWQLNAPNCEDVHDALLHSLPNKIKKRIIHRNDIRKKNSSFALSDHRIFHKGGELMIKPIQPQKEFEEIAALMQKQETEGYSHVREERYVIYRNFLLDKVSSYYKAYKKETGISIDYLFWVDMDLRGIDIQAIASEFSYAWRAGYDVVCTNGIKYTGWYYDSYATVYEDGIWAYGTERWRITNRIRGERFYEMKSCFGGFAAYNLPFLIESECRYHHFGWAYGRLDSFKRFADIYKIDRTCEHLPFNFCLREHGAKLAVASEAHSFYGTGDHHVEVKTMQARIKKELKDFNKKKKDGAGVEAEVVGKDMQHWIGRLKGPDDTPYDGGIFTVDIKIPDQYPFAPPKVTFNTRLWHPNVSSQTGAICLDILKDQWSPAMTIRTVLLSLQALLCAAEPDDPQDAQVAQQYKKDRKAFNKQAAEWTKKYAAKGLSIKEQESKIKKLMEMGIKRDHARAELSKHGWDTEAAINAYFGN